MAEWIANSDEEYIDKAVKFATDIKGLVDLRSGLRERMKNSPIMDAAGQTRLREEAFMAMHHNAMMA